MTTDLVSFVSRETLFVVAYVCAPVLGIALVVGFATPLVQPDFGFESKSSQCREFAAEGIRMICPALHFVMDVVTRSAIDTQTFQTL